MSKAFLISAIDVGDANYGTTYYQTLAQTGISWETTEANSQITYRSAGVLSDIYAKVSSNTINGTSTLRVRLNGGNGNQVVSIGSTATGEFVDATPSNTDAVSAGDEVNYSLVTGGSTGTMNVTHLITCFSATTDMTVRYAAINQAAQTDGTNRYWELQTSVPGTNNEACSQAKLRSGNTTFKNLFAYVSQNDISDATILNFRDDGVSVIALSITGNTTGIFENIADTSTPANNSLVNFFSDPPSVVDTHTITYEIVSVEGTSIDSTFYALSGNSNGSDTSTTNLFFAFSGRGSSNSTESVTLSDLLIACSVSGATVYISANTANGISTWTLNKDGIATDIAMSIAATTTGLFEDTDSVSFVSTDNPGYVMVRGGTGTITSRTAGAAIVTVSLKHAGFKTLLGVGW